MIKRISSSPPSFYFRDSTGERTYNKGIKMSIILLLSAIQWMWNHRLLRRSWIFFFFSSKEFKYQKLFSPAKFSFFHSRNKNNNDNSKQNLASKSFVPRTSFILSSTLNSPILSSRNDYSLSSSRSTFPFFFFFVFSSSFPLSLPHPWNRLACLLDRDATG